MASYKFQVGDKVTTSSHPSQGLVDFGIGIIIRIRTESPYVSKGYKQLLVLVEWYSVDRRYSYSESELILHEDGMDKLDAIL